MATPKKLTQSHNLISETTFHLKSSVLIIQRLLQNTLAGLKRFRQEQQLISAPVIALSESDLWSNDDNEQNKILTAGKVQNLRLALKKINGLQINADEVFSFWKHIGNPIEAKGYVIGREIREGCIVPAIAGGLCQLSNALYDAALQAGFEIIERHRHTKIIKGSLAEKNRDATVKWNYIDLRFKANSDFRIEAEMTSDLLIVRFRSNKNGSVKIDNDILLQPSKLNDCYSCGKTDCFKNSGITSQRPHSPGTTFILDEKWAEYDEYIKAISCKKDFFILPLWRNKIFKASRYNWSVKNHLNVKAVHLPALKRAFLLRLAAKSGKNLFSLTLRLDADLAKAAADSIPLESNHLVVSQNLLPFLFESGCLGGRTYDVIMNRLPFEKLHARLDAAHEKYPESKTLNDFRATQALINSENEALTKARNIITPHAEIAGMFKNKAVKLDWALPKAGKKDLSTSNKILFPGSALGRKGAYEIKRLAKESGIDIVLAGKATEEEGFWDNLSVTYAEGNPLRDICMVVYPAYIEHRPRLLLKALAAGIPVITTTACGLSPMENLTILPVGDYEALKKAVISLQQKLHFLPEEIIYQD